MAVVGRRDLWEEELVPPVPPVAVTDDAITGQSLVVDMFQTPPLAGLMWAMKLGDSLKSLLPDEKIQITIATKILGSDLSQSITFIRPKPEVDIQAGLPDWGFMIIMSDAGGPAFFVIRFVDTVFEFLTLVSLPSLDERLRITSDDNGGLVRLSVERWNGAGFDSVYFGQFADMLGMQGQSPDPIVILAGMDDVLPSLEGDKIIYDDIVIDSAAVIPPIPQTFPFIDDFEDPTWA